MLRTSGCSRVALRQDAEYHDAATNTRSCRCYTNAKHIHTQACKILFPDDSGALYLVLSCMCVLITSSASHLCKEFPNQRKVRNGVNDPESLDESSKNWL